MYSAYLDSVSQKATRILQSLIEPLFETNNQDDYLHSATTADTIL